MWTVLVVDDEFGITDALEILLSEEGFDVLVATNGRQALDRIEAKRPDLLLTDFMMPVMNGGEVIRRMKADPALAGIPIVMMSAMPETSIPADVRPDLFIRKPFELDDLLAAVKRLIGA